MIQTTRLLHSLRTQLDAAPWLRWALPVIGLLALAFVWQTLETWRTQAQETAIEKEVELLRIRSLEGEDVWFARAEEASAILERLRAELPAAATPGLAQASVQSWLRDNAMAGLPSDTLRVNVESSSTIDGIPGVLRVKVNMNGALTARQALGLLRQVEGADNLVVVETAMIRSDHNPMFTAVLNAYYRLPPAEPAS